MTFFFKKSFTLFIIIILNRRFPSHFASLVVGESMCHAKASVTLGFYMGILTKKKVLDFAHRKQGYFGG